MERPGRAIWICCVSAAFIAAPMTACRKPSTNSQAMPSEQAAKPQPAAGLTLKADEQSCRAFVQNFYDWYWNRTKDRMGDPASDGPTMPTLDAVLNHRPQLVSATLGKLLKADDELKKKTTDGIVGLEFDPFLNQGNGDVPTTPYTVENVSVADGKCLSTFNRVEPDSEVRPELMKTQSGWIFVNFHYSFYSEDGKTKDLPDDDLIHALSTE